MVGVEINRMRCLYGYYRKIFGITARGIFKFSNSYFWLIGALTVWAILRLLGYEMDLPNNILGGVMTGAAFFAATWVSVFLIRILFVSPFELFKSSSDRVEALSRKLQESEARLQEMMSPPDVTVMTDKQPLVFEREAVPESAGRPPGILIVFREVRIINRSGRNLSIEFKLKLWLKSRFYYALDQTSVRAWGALSEEEAASAIIGKRFPDVIDIATHTVESGSIVFFIPNEDEYVKRSVFLSLLNRFQNENVGDIIAELPKEIEMVELLSGRRAEFDATTAFSYNMAKNS